MSTDDAASTSQNPDLTASTATFPSDSEKYSSSNNDLTLSPEPRSEERTHPLILYSPPTLWSFLRGAAINMILPFVNGLMLGFGELFAHEAAFRLGWSNTRVREPQSSDFEVHKGTLDQTQHDGSVPADHAVRRFFPSTDGTPIQLGLESKLEATLQAGDGSVSSLAN